MTDDNEDFEENTTPDLHSLPFFSTGSTEEAASAGHLINAATGRDKTPPRSHNKPPQPTDPSPIDWALVAQFRATVSNLLSNSLESKPNMSDAEQKALAQSHIADVVRNHNDDLIRTTGEDAAWSTEKRRRIEIAVFDALFNLGRIQPLLDEPNVENIDIYGHDNVYVTYTTGETVQHNPVAESDQDLIRDIQFIASRGGEAGRSFTPHSPILDMDLPGGARLAAVAPPISPRPKIVIRVHRLVDITLDDMADQGTLTTPAANFLTALVRAGRSVVTSGFPGAGKTTLVRALANVLDPMEKIVTIEKERELYLDQMGDRHHLVTALQYRPGEGNAGPTGHRPGEVSLVDLLEESLRLDAQRIIVGEVRGGEIDAMFQAMQAGVGSFSTLHASSSTNAIERMATLTQKNLNTTDTYAYRQIAQHINCIIQVSKIRDRKTKKIRRIVTDISEIIPGGDTPDANRPIAVPIFQTDPNTHELTPVNRPTNQLLEDLTYEGFSLEDILPAEGAAQ